MLYAGDRSHFMDSLQIIAQDHRNLIQIIQNFGLSGLKLPIKVLKLSLLYMTAAYCQFTVEWELIEDGSNCVGCESFE